MRFYLLTILSLTILIVTGLSAKPYRGAEYRTKDTFLYGRFEVRMKSAQVSGMLASFFTYHEISSLQDWNEIDIELLGLHSDEVQFNTITPGQTNHVYEYETPFNPHQAFHVYAIEWTPDYVAWYVDSVEVYRQTGDHIQTLRNRQKLMMNIWQPDYPDWVGTFNEDDLPAFAYYDWIQYYRYTPQTDERFTLQWRDDLNDWDQSRWDKATHTWDSNNSVFVHENVVFQDGYMILCLTMPDNLGYDGGAVIDEDRDPPYVTSGWFYENDIEVHFSEPVERESALNPSNYIMPAFSEKTHFRLLDNDQTVRFSVAERTEDVKYNLVVLNVKDKRRHIMPLQQLNVLSTPFIPFQINVGGSAEGDFRADQEWNTSTAYGFSGGQIVRHGEGVVFDATDKDAVYRNELRDLRHYQLRLPEGRYNVTLMFAETEFNQSAQRVFDVYGEGRLLIDDLDIYQNGGTFSAWEEKISDLSVSDQTLDLYFEAAEAQSVLSGIKIERNTTSISHSPAAFPQSYRLHLYPNPFNPASRLQYELPKSADIRIVLYDSAGRLVKTVVQKKQRAGRYVMRLEVDNLGAGLYFCALYADGRLGEVQKAIILK